MKMKLINKYKYNMISVTTVMLFVLGFIFNIQLSQAQNLVNLKQNSIFFISQGATVQVNGGLTIDNNATLTQSSGGYSRLYFNGGNFDVNGNFNAGVGAVVFNYSETTEITSGSSITFNQIVIDKSTISNSVIFNTNFTAASDTINTGTQSFGTDDDWTMAISQNVVINSNGDLTVESGSEAHILNLSRNLIINNGNINAINGGSKLDINLVGSGNVSVSGSSSSGSVNFSELTINKNTTTDTVTFSRNFTSPIATGFINMTRGTLNFSGTENISAALFKANSNLVTISSNSRVLFNNVNLTLTGQDADILLDGGRFVLNAGTLNVGNGGSRGNLFYNNNAQFTQTNGTINVTKSFARDLSNDNAAITFVKSGGVFRAGSERSSLSTRGVFDLASTSSQITWSAGDIEILRNSSSFTNGDYYVRAAALSGGVTGGHLYFAPNTNDNSENAFKINSTRAVNNLTMLTNGGAATPQVEQVENNLLILNNLTLTGRGYVQSAAQLELQGNFVNNATTGSRFDPKTNRVLFSGSNSTQTISGTVDTLLFYDLSINKTSGRHVTSEKPLTIGRSLRLIGNNRLKMGDNDLRIKVGAGIFSNATDTLQQTNGMDLFENKFSQNKYIEFSGTTSTGSIIRELNPNPSTGAIVYYYRFPFGTGNNFSGFYVRLRRNETTIAAGAEIKIKAIAEQHPDITEPNIALKKYFNIESTGLTLLEESASIKYEWINAAEIQGDINNYDYMFFRTQDNWYDNPGAGGDYTILSTNVYMFQLDDITFNYIDGDWTAGPRSAVEAIYYSIANGPWDSVGTWSRVGYGQVAASSYPQSNLDLVYIGDGKTVTLDYVAPELRGVYVQSTGRLNIASGAYIEPALDGKDTLRVEAGATLGIADPDGIREVANQGNVRNTTRIFSNQGIYVYNGTTNQTTGDGLPNTVGSLIIENTGATDSTVTPFKAIEIKDSLVINRGKFNIVNTSCDGEIPNRILRMRGGELAVATFPTKYASPTFTGGTINFAGTSSFTVPSSSHPSTPVNQYYNLKLSAALGSNSNITFDPVGEIKISKSLDISQLTFDPIPNSQRILVSGSTVNFNGNEAQTIPSGYTDARALVYRLNYDNIKIDGTGVKTFANPNDLTGIGGADNYVDISGNVTITNGSTLNSGNYDLRIRKNFVVNPGGIYQAGTGRILFNTSGNTNQITLNGQELYDLEVEDNSTTGVLQFMDNATINNNLIVNTSRLRTTTQTVNIKGNFTQNGILDLGTGTINFNGTSNQNLVFTGSGSFYNLSVNKTAGNVIVSGGSNLVITNQLTLTQGNIGGRPTGKAIQVNGTISRPGLTPGHVDGPLRLNFGIGAIANTTFPVGIGTDYNPMEIQLTGGGGTAGLLEVNVNTDIVSGDVDAVIIETGKPNGAELSSLQNIPKRWEVTADWAGNTFALGARKYNAVFNFLPADIRNGANTAFFEVTQRNGTNNTGGWIATNTGIRTGSSVSILNNEVLPSNAKQFFYGGSPANLTFYSVGSGNWSNPNIWSTASYGSVDIAPRAPGASDNVRIGDGKTVTLDVNHTVNAGKVVTVEKAGPSNLGGFLNLSTFVISGPGTFNLNSEGGIGIGSAAGITTSGATGNIQTTTRNYNPGSHGNAHFVYNGTGAQVTGNAFPLTVKTFTVDKPSGTLTFTGSSPIIFYIKDSLYFKSGGADFSTLITKLSGNYRIANGFNWLPGTTSIPGSAAWVSATNTVTDINDSTITPGGFIFNGGGTQYVWREGETDNTFLLFNRFSPSKASGEIICNTNIEAAQLFFHPRNRANVNVRKYNKFFNIYASTNRFNVLRLGFGDVGFDSLAVPTYGWLNGRMIRLLPSQRQFPIGTDDRYTPAELTPSNGFTQGLIEITAFEGNHPNFNPAQINKNTNVQKYWEITRPINMPGGYPTFTFNAGGRLDMRLIYTENEPRGGVDPAESYNMFRYTGAGNLWDSTTNIQQDEQLALETRADLNLPNAIGDAVFNTFSSTAGTNAIVLMVGQAGEGTERVFYSRQSGNWRDSTTWSSVAYGSNTNTYNDFPKLATDIVNIGAFNGVGHRVVLDTALITVSSVDIDTVNGSYGILSVPGENILSGRQFVQKYGAELEIGSADGINTIPSPPVFAMSDYIFEQSTGVTYTEFNDGTVWNSGNSNWNSISTVNLGFTFNFNGVNYTQVRLNDDGYLGFGTTTTLDGNPISSGTGTVINLVSAMGRNLRGRDVNSNIRYKTTGVSPNRTFIAQWDGLRLNNSGNNNDNLNFQIHLEESTNDIKILYGASSINSGTAQTVQVGIKGPSNAMSNIQNRTTTNNWSATTAGTANNSTCSISNTITIPSGLQFRWYRNPVSNGTGNIQTTLIRNYNFNNLNRNRYVYIGSGNQNTGSGLPSTVAKLEIKNTGATNDNIVTLSSAITITDTLELNDGRLSLPNTTNALYLQGHLENNSEPGALTAFNTAHKFIFSGDSTQQNIFGTVDSTIFDMNVEIDKSANTAGNIGNVSITGHNVRFNQNVTFNSDSKLQVADNRTLTMGPSNAFVSTNGDFGENRMVMVSGNSTTGRIRKQFTIGSGVDRNFTIPVGENSNGNNNLRYNATYFAMKNMTFNADNYVNLDLRATYPHPNAPAGTVNMLKKYWSFSSQNIVRGTGTTDVELLYNDSGLVGNRVNYLPTSYRRAASGVLPGWSFILDNPTYAKVDTINRKIIVTNAKRLIDHDWTAADPAEFSFGRKFWSRSTGKWSEVATWTNDETNTYLSQDTALNVPGYFPGDTVFISGGHTVTYDTTTANPINILNINENNIATGDLQFETISGANANKYLIVKEDVNIGLNGKLLKQDGAGVSVDTLIIWRNLNNFATIGGRGISTFVNQDEHTFIKFMGDTTSEINGTGLFDNIGTIIMSKDLPTLSLTNNSSSFCTGFTNSINNSPPVDFLLNAGTYVHNVNSAITMTNDLDGDLLLGSNVRLNIKTGTVTLEDGLICGQDSKVIMENGTLNVGNAEDEALSYESVTEINIQNNSNLRIAGNLRRRFNTSSASIFISGNPLIELMIQGAQTNLSSRRAGFDIGEASSVFNMNGGTIILYRPMESVFDGNNFVKDEDIKISASDLTSTIQSGLFQVGSTTILDVPPSGGDYDKMSILSTIQFSNLTFENTYNRDMDFGTGELRVKDNLLIKTDAKVSMNGQNLTVGGNFTVEGSGEFKTGLTGTRQVKLNGILDQTVRFENNTFNDSYLGFWDFIVEKSGGDVIFPGDALGSNLYVRNSLQFASNNVAKIILDSTKYVKSGISVATPGNVQKFGGGWIVGELKKWINTGAISVVYPVGTNTNFTPATITTTGGPMGTPGYLNVKPFGYNPPDVPDSLLMEQTTYIHRFWNIVPNDIDPFDLGSGRSYTLNLQWIKGTAPTGDLRNGATFGLFEIFRRDPIFGSAGTWTLHQSSLRTDSSTTTANLVDFGSFVIGESAGETFYSIADGDWFDPLTWSKEGYDGPPETIDYPQQAGDIVRIGNGKSVRLGSAFNKNLKSVIVESIDGNKGKLSIVEGASIRGLIFQLKDSCTLETNDNFGFTKLGGPSSTTGAVRTTVSRIYGKSRYEYRGGQTMTVGDGLPDEVFTIVIDNTAENNNQVNLASNTIIVEDTVNIVAGRFSLLDKEMNLKGQLVMEVDTEIEYGTGNFRVSGNQNQVLRLNNEEMAVYNMLVDKQGGSVIVDGNNIDARVLIKNNLRFTDSNSVKIDLRSTGRLMVLDSNATVTRLGGGFVDGRVRVWMPSGSFTKIFPIGINNDYMYAIVEGNTNPTDTVKYVEGIVYDNPPLQPFVGNRLDGDSRLNYYWSLTPLDSTDDEITDRLFKTKFRVPNSLITNFDITNSVIRRRSVFAELGEWTERRYDQLIWNTDTSTVAFAPSTNSWTGLGEFFIGEKAKRVFYAVNDGLWSSNTTWSFSPDGSNPVPAGIFPNNDWNLPSEYITEVRDSVIINDFNGNPVNVTLDTRPELAFINLDGTSSLIMLDTTYISGSPYGTSAANFDGGIIDNKTPLGITSDVNTSLFRFTPPAIFSNDVSFIFSGEVKQQLGDAFPSTVAGLTFNNTGDSLTGDNIIVLPPSTLNITDFSILNGDLRPTNADSDLRVSGDILLNNTFNFTLDENDNPVCPKLTFTGEGTDNQILSGSGRLVVCEISMDRGAGNGITSTQIPVDVTQTFDLREGSNTNQQVFEVGDGGELYIMNSNPTTSILDVSTGGPLRYIQTTPTGGSLIREVTSGNTYVYPVGSFENGDFLTAFATYTADAGGTNGKMGVRTSSGTNATFDDGHLNLSFGATDYIGRYWAIDSITHNLTGKFRFDYNDQDIVNQENDINTIGHWTGAKENSSGTWNKLTDGLNLASNFFETPNSLTPAGLGGDWTIGNFEAFMRIFYSRMTGNWSSDQSWTLSPTHVGPIVGIGVIPNLLGDSVVVGGGLNGVNNHNITLDIDTVTTTGVQVGGSGGKTGSLILNENIISGLNFRLLSGSELYIGNADGISLTGNIGNIRTSNLRFFSDSANYIYNGVVNQITGSGLPNMVNSLSINNSGLDGFNIVTLTNNVNVIEDLIIEQGVLDLTDKTANAVLSSTGTMEITEGAKLIIGATNSMTTAANNYSNYIINDNSTIEFNGTDQIISNLPGNLNITGIGNLIVRNVGDKDVNAAMLVKGKLDILAGCTLQILPGIDSMKILGNVCNEGSILDIYGVMDIGQQ